MKKSEYVILIYVYQLFFGNFSCSRYSLLLFANMKNQEQFRRFPLLVEVLSRLKRVEIARLEKLTNSVRCGRVSPV